MRLGDIDRDDAIAEALDALHGTTRAAFLRRAALGSAALLAASAAPASAAAGPPRRGDPQLRAHARVRPGLLLQRGRADRRLTGPLAEQARVVAAHERAHVEALREVLGSRAVKRPRFDFRGATEDAERFRKTAVAFEDLAVAAYKAQAPLIQSRAYLVPRWPSTPSRRATPRGSGAWPGISPAADAFDEPRSKQSARSRSSTTPTSS